MRTRVFAGIFAVGFAVLAVACGTSSDGGDVPSNSVAVVGDRTITKAEFDDLVTYAKRSYTAQKRPFPKVGTPEYAQIRDQAVRFLVQRAQFEVKAGDLGVDVERRRGRQARRAVQEGAPRRQRGEVPGRAQVSGPVRGPGAGHHPGEPRPGGDLQQGHRRRQGHGQADPGPLREEQGAVRHA